jgi:hypothetical protein
MYKYLYFLFGRDVARIIDDYAEEISHAAIVSKAYCILEMRATIAFELDFDPHSIWADSERMFRFQHLITLNSIHEYIQKSESTIARYLNRSRFDIWVTTDYQAVRWYKGEHTEGFRCICSSGRTDPTQLFSAAHIRSTFHINALHEPSKLIISGDLESFRGFMYEDIWSEILDGEPIADTLNAYYYVVIDPISICTQYEIVPKHGEMPKYLSGKKNKLYIATDESNLRDDVNRERSIHPLSMRAHPTPAHGI